MRGAKVAYWILFCLNRHCRRLFRGESMGASSSLDRVAQSQVGWTLPHQTGSNAWTNYVMSRYGIGYSVTGVSASLALPRLLRRRMQDAICLVGPDPCTVHVNICCCFQGRDIVLPEHEEKTLRGILFRWLHGNAFNYTVSILVFLNAILIGAQTDYAAQHGGASSLPWCGPINHFFCIVFTAEVCCKVFVYGCEHFFWRDSDWTEP
eukprot:g15795.t1